MKKRMRRVLSLLLIGAIGVTAAGCGDATTQSSDAAETKSSDSIAGETEAARKQPDGEVTTVNLTMPTAYDASDTQLVQDALNEVLGPKYGLNIELTIVNFGSWADQTNLLLTGNEVDVIAYSGSPLTTFVSNGQALNLTEYYNNASEEFKQVWSEEAMKGTMINGSIYAVPNFRNFGNRFGLTIDAEIAAEFGIEDGQKMTLDDVDAFLEEVSQSYTDRYAIVPQGSKMLVNGWTWDGLGDGSFIGVLPDKGQDTTVQNVFETDDFLELVSHSRKWYEEGWMMQDALSNTEDSTVMIQSKKAVCALANYANNSAAGCIRTVIVDEWSVANSYSELCYGINALSSKPEAAWKLIEILHTDEEVCKLLNNGIEGKHYVLNEDGTASFPDDKAANDTGWGMTDLYWMTPYSALAYPMDVNGSTFYEDLQKFNEETLKSKAHGFYFDTSEVVDPYAACINVMSKYYEAILVGALDTEETIAKANAELEAAGLQEVISAKQKQLDEFLAGK